MPRLVSRHFALLATVAGLSLALAGCGTKTADLPSPSPANFPGIVSALADAGITVSQEVSGDAGCNDAKLVPTAIGFTATGLDQAAPVRIHIYIFADSATWSRLSIEVATCAQSFVTDPSTYELGLLIALHRDRPGPLGEPVQGQAHGCPDDLGRRRRQRQRRRRRRKPLDDAQAEDPAGDHEPLDLARPLADLGQLGVAQVALDLVLLDVAVAAVDLDRGVGDAGLTSDANSFAWAPATV